MSQILAAANLTKTYIGIGLTTVPYSISKVGLYGAIICFIYIIILAIFTMYLLTKARNRFKRQKIVDICDLGCAIFGEWVRPFITFFYFSCNFIFTIIYIIFIGT